MLDPKLLRSEPERVREQLSRRGYSFELEKFQALEARRKALQVETEALQAERNTRSREIGIAKGKGEDVAPLMLAMEDLKHRLDANTAALDKLQQEFNLFLLNVPNIPHPSVPDGRSEERRVGKECRSRWWPDH